MTPEFCPVCGEETFDLPSHLKDHPKSFRLVALGRLLGEAT